MAEEPKPPSPTPGPGAKSARAAGPIAPAIYTAGAKTGSYRPAADVNEPLVTEGMKARQRQTEKKRRAVAMLRQVENEEAEDRWRRGRRWIYAIVGILFALGVYWKMQSVYGDKWPLLGVWIFLGLLILTALTSLFWYLDYSD